MKMPAHTPNEMRHINLSRRDFIRASLLGVSSFALAGCNLTGDSRNPFSSLEGAKQLDGKFWFDGHTTPYYTGFPVPESICKAIRDSGLTAVSATAMDPNKTWDQVLDQFDLYRKIADEPSNLVMIVRCLDDFRVAHESGRLGLMLNGEDPTPLGIDLDNLNFFYDRGLRTLQLTYNYQSQFGDGCLAPAQRGLTALGQMAVERMNELGMTVNCSHACKNTMAETIALSKKPMTISHTGCNGVFRHPRNVDDSELRTMAEKGGVVGIYLEGWFLSPGPQDATAEDFFAHLAYALNICGEDHVGIGTDQPIDAYPLIDEVKKLWYAGGLAAAGGKPLPGMHPNRWAMIPELHRTDRFAVISDGLAKRGYGHAIDKVMGRNFYRVFGETW